MIGLETNVLLRWLITGPSGDDESDRQIALVSKALGGSDETFFINHVVLAETLWVLRNRAGQSKKLVGEIVDRLLHSSNVEVDRSEIVSASRASFLAEPGDFTDHLIGQINRSAGCRTTLTFDHKASKTRSLFTRLTR